MIVGLLVGCVVALSIVLYLIVRELNSVMHHTHAKCVSHIAHYVGDEYAAMVLIAAAQDWDSAEEASRLKVLARLRHSADGPSMPAIWLEDRALRLRDGLGSGTEAV